MSGLTIIKNSSFKDNRGFYWTTWKKEVFKNLNLIMINFLYQKKVLRGLHCDFKSWKLVTCTFGKVFLVVVNMKKIQKII